MPEAALDLSMAKTIARNFREGGHARALYDFYWDWKKGCASDAFVFLAIGGENEKLAESG